MQRPAIIELRVIELETIYPVIRRRAGNFLPKGDRNFFDTPKIQVHAVKLVHPAWVTVRIDEPRYDSHAFGINDLSIRSTKITNVIKYSRLQRIDHPSLQTPRLSAAHHLLYKP